MKLPVLLSAVVAACLAEEAKVLPLASAGYPYAGLHAGAYGYAGLHAAYPYALPAPAKVEVKTVEAPALPALTYAAAPAAAYAAAAPVIAAAPYTAGSQFHAQDEFGNLNYGYANINSAKQEVGNTYGGVSGGYSYVDANGELQQVQYIADGAGFRVADSRLPVAPVYDGVAPTFNPEPLVAPVFDGVAPAPVVDTPEVAEAKAAHLAAVEAAKADRKKRDAEADPAIISGYSPILSAPTPLIHNAPVYRAAYTHALPYTTYGHGFGYGLNRFFY